jgi:agmatine deiminase
MEVSVTERTIAVPAEWAPQRAIWTAWPADAEEWARDLETPRRDVAALVRALAPSNKVRLLVNGAEAKASARASLGGAAEIVPARYGDIWLRDTGPVFARTREGAIALRFSTNGWGGKFDLPDDATVGDDIARLAGTPIRKFDFVLEGGAVEHDGEGTILTTRGTVLNENRNGWAKDEAEAALRDAFGADKIVWLDEGLNNDHTDDPNAEILNAVARTLEAATDARGRKLHIVRVPSPGLVLNETGDAAPASHMNFVIANGVVVVPVYGTPSAEVALDALRAIFPDREVIGLPSRGLLGSGMAGGGSFHCITREEPA